MTKYLKARTPDKTATDVADERQILMNPFSVNGLNKGLKTQTRRLATDDMSTTSIRWVENVDTTPNGNYTGWIKECGAPLFIPIKCRYGVVGDRLWVKETWAIKDCGARVQIQSGKITMKHRLQYPGTDEAPATDGKGRPYWWNKRPSIFMPRWASRYLLEVKEIRAERVQDITSEDAIAEGIERECGRWKDYRKGGEKQACLSDPRDSYRTVWDSINAKPKPVYGRDKDGKKVIVRYVSYPWETAQEARRHRGKPWFVIGNPWVFVIVFLEIKA